MTGVAENRLAIVAQTFQIPFEGEESELAEKCYHRAYEACQKGEWELIEQAIEQLKTLSNKMGISLFAHALFMGNDEVVVGLLERDIILLSGLSEYSAAIAILERIQGRYNTTPEHILVFRRCSEKLLELKRLERGEDDYEVALARFNHSTLCLAMQDVSSAVEHLTSIEQSVGRSLETEGCSDEQYQLYISICGRLADIYGQNGDIPMGLEIMEKLLGILEKRFGAEDKRLTHALFSLGTFYRMRGQLDDARRSLERALNLVEVDDELQRVDLLCLLALVERSCNNYEMAIKLFSEALEIYRKDPTKNGLEIARTLSNLGNVFFRMGAFKEAIEHHNLAYQSLKLVDGDNRLDMAGIRENVANAYCSIGQYTLAMEAARESLALKEEKLPANHNAICLSLGNLARILASRKEENDLRDARGYLQRALEIAKVNEDNLSIARTSSNMATLSMELGQIDESSQLMKEAKEAFSKLERLPAEYGQFLIIYGSLCIELKDYDLAIELHHQAVEFNRAIGAFDHLSQSYMALGGAYKEREDYVNAEKYFRYAIDQLNRNLDQLSEDQWQISSFEECSFAYSRLEFVLHLQGKMEEAAVIADMRKAKSLESKLREKTEGSSKLPSVISVAEMKQLATTQNATFISFSYLSEEEVLHIYVVRADGVFFHVINDHQITEDVEDIVGGKGFPYKSFEENVFFEIEEPSKAPMSEEERQRLLNDARNHLDQRLKEFYQTYILPIAKFLPAENGRIVFVPDTGLPNLPFHLLHGERGYLFEQYAISTAPSMMVLRLLERSPKIATQRTLVVDSPASKTPIVTGGAESQVLCRLALAHKEDILSGSKATIENVVSRMKQVSRVHFSCHGSDNTKKTAHSMYQGGLFLTPVEEDGGILHADKISDLSTHIDLVFTSACSTGIGKKKKEGMIGLVRAFIASGALSVIASSWRVSDSEGTVQLVEHFYSGLLGGLSKSDALRAAMLEGKKRCPKAIEKWGAFFLTGLS